jgi:hypothetical protein
MANAGMNAVAERLPATNKIAQQQARMNCTLRLRAKRRAGCSIPLRLLPAGDVLLYDDSCC